MDSGTNVWRAAPLLHQWLTVVAIGVLAGHWLAVADDLFLRDCVNPTDDWRTSPCLDDAVTSLVLSLAVPVGVIIVTAIAPTLRARDVWAAVLYPLGMHYTASSLHRFDGPDIAWWEPLPWMVWIGASTAVMTAAWLLVRKAATPGWLRFGPAQLLVGGLAVFVAFVGAVEDRVLVRAVEATGVELYLPEFGGHRLSEVGVVQGEVHLRFDGQRSSVELRLISASGRSTCEVVQLSTWQGAAECNGDGTRWRNQHGDWAFVLRRDDTVLIAEPSQGLWLDRRLEEAPAVDARTVVHALDPP